MFELAEYTPPRKPKSVSIYQMMRLSLIDAGVPHSKMDAAAEAGMDYMEAEYTSIQTAANAVAGDYQ